MNKKVSIQGYEGCFHQLAARQYYGSGTQVINCASFKEVVSNAAAGKNGEGAIIAIENSIAGTILANYNLILKHKVQIVGEVYLHIKQHLLVNPGVLLEDIKEVHSHYMAIQQCAGYLDKHHWKLVETEDTALSARHIHQYNSRHAAAIAGKMAAELYGLEIIAPNIHTIKNNYTRFLVLQKEGVAGVSEPVDKASVNFVIPNKTGSLVRVLGLIAEAGINLSKLQSMPIPGTNFKYSFHVDMEFSNLDQFNRLVGQLKRKTEQLIILGVYKKGKIQ